MTWMGSYNQKNTLTFTLHRCSSIMTHHVYAHQFLGKSPTRLTQCVSQANKISDITHVKNAVPPPPPRYLVWAPNTYKERLHEDRTHFGRETDKIQQSALFYAVNNLDF